MCLNYVLYQVARPEALISNGKFLFAAVMTQENLLALDSSIVKSICFVVKTLISHAFRYLPVSRAILV